MVQAAHDGLMVWKIFFLALFLKHQLVLNITMSSLNLNDPQKVTRSPSNRAPYGCCRIGDSRHDVQPTNLQNVSDAVMSLWTRNSITIFQAPC